MSPEAIQEFLRNNLSIQIDEESNFAYNDRTRITFKLVMTTDQGREVISSDYIELAGV